MGRLNAVGYAYKDLCPADKRGIYAVITGAGRECYTAARISYAEVLGPALNTAGADPLLARVVQALRSSV